MPQHRAVCDYFGQIIEQILAVSDLVVALCELFSGLEGVSEFVRHEYLLLRESAVELKQFLFILF